MAYRCMGCGRLIEDDEIVRSVDVVGFYGDIPYGEEVYTCPHCHEDNFEDEDEHIRHGEVWNEEEWEYVKESNDE